MPYLPQGATHQVQPHRAREATPAHLPLPLRVLCERLLIAQRHEAAFDRPHQPELLQMCQVPGDVSLLQGNEDTPELVCRGWRQSDLQ